jgi:hypothetical protein
MERNTIINTIIHGCFCEDFISRRTRPFSKFSRMPTSPANAFYKLTLAAQQYVYLTKPGACKDKKGRGKRGPKKKDWVPGEGGETGTQREINGVSGYRIRFIQYATSMTTLAIQQKYFHKTGNKAWRGKRSHSYAFVILNGGDGLFLPDHEEWKNDKSR